jgi:hypothetical protein
MAIEFRFLNAEDTPAYWNIRLEALQCEPEAFGSSVEEHCALPLAEITAYRVIHRTTSWLARSSASGSSALRGSFEI